MHTREQALTRLQEIVEYVKGIDEKIVNLDAWLSVVGQNGEPPRECGTICCIIGWMGIENQFGMTFDDDDTPYMIDVDWGGKQFRRYGFSAAAKMLFGNNFGETENGFYNRMYKVVRMLFSPVDEQDIPILGVGSLSSLLRLPHKEVFMKRAEYAVGMINDLYDEIEAM